MRIEHGCFEGLSDQLMERAQARVFVEEVDFQRLELREFESGGRLSPCLSWCHEKIGGSYLRWQMIATPGADIFYFARPEDAEAFFAEFSEKSCAGSSDLPMAA